MACLVALLLKGAICVRVLSSEGTCKRQPRLSGSGAQRLKPRSVAVATGTVEAVPFRLQAATQQGIDRLALR